MKVVSKYFNEELGVFVSVLATRKARPTERTWPCNKGSVTNLGGKRSTLRAMGYSKANRG
jgi:hypothetical protein